MSFVRESYFSEQLDPKEYENLEDLTIVWFDKTVNQSDDCIQFQSRLRHIINYLVVFDDFTECENYLLLVEQEKIFLIVSGTNGESLISKIHHLSKINSIYVFCFKHDDSAKKNLLDISRQQYIGNNEELSKIADFEANYTADKAIWWYTRNSFLYRLLNRALRTENFDVIYKFRSFIADLHQQLKRMHPAYVDRIFSSEDTQIFYVYRGQRLFSKDFEKLKQNINGFVSMNTFLSTTTQSSVALIYSGNGEGRPLFESYK
ncbi:unnamed protein product [Rotaria sp. Silwood1]|nr:unnamed protein product [Rotaria sp. Silwood1]